LRSTARPPYTVPRPALLCDRSLMCIRLARVVPV
jgi:hypothetical protein